MNEDYFTVPICPLCEQDEDVTLRRSGASFEGIEPFDDDDLEACAFCGRMTTWKAIYQVRTHSPAPSEGVRPATGSEATEAGGPSGSADLAGAGGRGTLHAEGAGELALPPEPGDLQVSEAHSPGAETVPSAPTPSGVPCATCGRPIPERAQRFCDAACRREQQRHDRFVRRKAVRP